MRTTSQVLVLLFTTLASIPAVAAGTELAIADLGNDAYVHYGRHQDMSIANAGDIANPGFVIGSRSVAVIDPGGSGRIAQALRAAIADRTSLPISHLVLTHAHPDHVFGAGVFADVPNVIAHQHYVRAANVRTSADRARFAALAPQRAAPAPTVTIAAGDHHDIDLGERLIRVVAMPPAHTDHDLLVIDAQADLVWASDLIVETRLPSLDGHLGGWLAVLDELAADPSLATATVVPGHGQARPLVRLIERQRGYLGWLRSTVRAHLDAGDTLSGATREAERFAEQDDRWQLDELHHPANLTRAWTELEWE